MLHTLLLFVLARLLRHTATFRRGSINPFSESPHVDEGGIEAVAPAAAARLAPAAGLSGEAGPCQGIKLSWDLNVASAWSSRGVACLRRGFHKRRHGGDDDGNVEAAAAALG